MRPTSRMLLACSLSFAAGIGAACASASQEAQETSRREPQFENEHVKVWKTIIMPNQPLSMHRHDHGRALIALTDGTLDVIAPDSSVIKTYNWEAGKAYWLDVDPPGEVHGDLNNGTKPIEVIVVELKNDVK